MTNRDRRYSTARWRRLREQVIRRDGRVCSVEDCTSDMSQRGMTHIDHIIEVKDDGALWDPSNYRVVCRFHHYSKTVEKIGERASGGGGLRDPYGRTFSADGHWKDTESGREPASPNDIRACDNPRCSWCKAEGYQ